MFADAIGNGNKLAMRGGNVGFSAGNSYGCAPPSCRRQREEAKEKTQEREHTRDRTKDKDRDGPDYER